MPPVQVPHEVNPDHHTAEGEHARCSASRASWRHFPGQQRWTAGHRMVHAQHARVFVLQRTHAGAQSEPLQPLPSRHST